MNWKKLALSLVLGSSLAMAGCGDDSNGGPVDPDGGGGDDGGNNGDLDAAMPDPIADSCPADGPDTGDTYFYVVNELAFATQDPETGYVPGFNLDGFVTPPGGTTGCGQADHTFDVDKDGEIADWENGIDNQIASLAPTLESFLNLQDEVSAGSIIVLAEVAGVDDFTTDDCVEASLLLGQLPDGVTPAELDMDMDGLIDPGNEFLIDPLSYDETTGDPLINVTGVIDNGGIRFGPIDITLNVDLDGTPVSLTVRNATVSFDITADTLTNGVIGGALNVDDLVTLVSDVLDMPGLADTIRGVLEPVADLQPNSEGVCQAVSVGLSFEGVDAINGGDVPAM